MNPLHAVIQMLTQLAGQADDPEDKAVFAQCIQALMHVAQKEQSEPAAPAGAPAAGGPMQMHGQNLMAGR